MNKIVKYLSLASIFFAFLNMEAYAELSSNWFITNNWGSATSTNVTNTTTIQSGTNSTTTGVINIATTTSTSLQNTNQSNTQNITLPVYMNVSANVQNSISILKQKYNLNNSQISSLTQIARSYQYVLYNKPDTKERSNIANIRDVAATNCAESRLPEVILDDVVSQIEIASLDTQAKKSVYQNYINFIDDNSSYQNTLQACEDEFSNTNVINISDTNNQNYNSNYPGIVSDLNIKSPCLVLTSFMEYKSKSAQVSLLQNFLMENGYLEMYPTGFFGRNTEAAIKEWQNRHGISALGWTGPSTRGSIAQITCKDQSSVNRAVKGEVYKAPIVKKAILVKKTIAKVSDKGGYVEVKKPTVIVATSTTIITSTTTVIEETVTPVITQTLNNMSSRGGTFYTKRNPVNTLYFSYKANVIRDEVFICIEKTGQISCGDNNNYVLLREKYEPGNIDSISNGDRWIFNLYYNANLWSNTGGKIYLKNGISSISEAYTIKVVDSLQ
jgi:peptidoglycan hydrolase-like protein with peptidoglycan-binding domain